MGPCWMLRSFQSSRFTVTLSGPIFLGVPTALGGELGIHRGLVFSLLPWGCPARHGGSPKMAGDCEVTNPSIHGRTFSWFTSSQRWMLTGGGGPYDFGKPSVVEDWEVHPAK